MHDVFTWPVGRAQDGWPAGTDRAAPVEPVVAYWLAAIAGGTTTGLLFGVIGEPVRAMSDSGQGIAVLPLFLVGVIAIALQVTGTIRPLPERRHQVPRRWLHWRHRSRTAAAFGYMIGAGLLTPVKYASAYVLAALVILAPTLGAAVAVGAVYGGTRGGVLAVTWVADRHGRRLDWEALHFRPWLNPALGALAALSLVAGIAMFVSQ